MDKCWNAYNLKPKTLYSIQTNRVLAAMDDQWASKISGLKAAEKHWRWGRNGRKDNDHRPAGIKIPPQE